MVEGEGKDHCERLELSMARLGDPGAVKDRNVRVRRNWHRKTKKGSGAERGRTSLRIKGA